MDILTLVRDHTRSSLDGNVGCSMGNERGGIDKQLGAYETLGGVVMLPQGLSTTESTMPSYLIK